MGAGLAVAASTAKPHAELLTIRIGLGLVRLAPGGFGLAYGHGLIHLGLAVATGQDEQIRIAAQKAQGQITVVDHAAGKGLHDENPQARRLGFGEQHDRSLGLHDIVRKLYRGEKAARHELSRHLQTVGGDADMADLALRLGLDQRLHGAARPEERIKLLLVRHLMGLGEIYIIGAKALETQLQLLHGPGRPSLAGLGGNDDLVAHSGKGPPHLFLAVHIAVGRIKEGHTAIDRMAQDRNRLIQAKADDGNAAKADGRNPKSRRAKCHRAHTYSVSPVEGPPEASAGV